MRRFVTSMIILFSESIWVYYLFALFISVEWDAPVFVPMTWWIVAGVAGYVLNRIAAGRMNDILVMGGNIIILLVLVIQNWKTSVPEGSWMTVLFFSLAICFVYIRSVILVFQDVRRTQMLVRFEVNLFSYLAFIVMFTLNDWVNDYFHVIFLLAIFGTLFGLILTLASDGATADNEHVVVHQVGHASGLLAGISLLFGGVIVMSSLFFFPAVRDQLQYVTFFAYDLLVSSLQRMGTFLSWILSFFNEPESDGMLPDVGPNMSVDIQDAEEEVFFSLPIGWIIAGVSMIVIIVLLFVFRHFLKSWRPNDLRRPQKRRQKGRFQWHYLIQKLRELMQRLTKRWRAKFARYYKRDVYWHFTQIERWGKKQGIIREPSATVSTYVEQLIRALEQSDINAEEKVALIQGLQAISVDYEAAYYGNKDVHGHYKQLVKDLKQLKIKKHDRLE